MSKNPSTTDAFGPADPKYLDLRWGDPVFMQPYWKSRNNDITVLSGSHMGYSSAGGLERLKKSIVELHDSVGNAETKDYHVVVGAGASQILQAALYALKDKVTGVEFQPPYFPRFGTFATLIGLDWNDASKNAVEIITSPNNPDGKLMVSQFNEQYQIYDYCYNWPQYLDKPIKGNQDIMVFSLAKATGHAATRIGWALVKDKALAQDMEHYIELSTSGVSYEAQAYAASVIRSQLIDFNGTCFKHGQDKLARRWETIKEAFKNKQDIKLLNTNGMFLWCESESTDASKYMQDKYGINAVGGQHFGCITSMFRMNLGCGIEDFEKLLEKLK